MCIFKGIDIEQSILKIKLIYLKKISKDEIDRSIDRSLEDGSRRFYELQNDNNHPSLGNRMKINCRYSDYARYAEVAFQSLDGTYYKLTIKAMGY